MIVIVITLVVVVAFVAVTFVVAVVVVVMVVVAIKVAANIFETRGFNLSGLLASVYHKACELGLESHVKYASISVLFSNSKFFQGGFGDLYNYNKQSSSVWACSLPLSSSSGVLMSKRQTPISGPLLHRSTSPGVCRVS